MVKDYSWVRGFNYQPGYAYNSYEAWRFFDEKVFEKELSNGKNYYPGFNVVRYWLSYEAFRYEEDRQAENFEKALKIADKLDLKVIPVLFNRWHDYDMDNGGIYIDHMIPESSTCSQKGGTKFDSYISKIVKAHKDDSRILLWDFCNEPYSYAEINDFTSLIQTYEKKWLEKIYCMCKEAGATQPVSFSPAVMDSEFMEEHKHICDVFLLHIYERDSDNIEQRKEKMVKYLTEIKNTATKLDRGIFTTETCWGALTDEERMRRIEVVLEPHNKVGLGFIAHALAYSKCPDLHYQSDGIVSIPGNLAFLNKDGTLRKGHEIFNKY